MSRRAAIVEEFDDETDLPLPSRPLPNTGTKGAILEAVTDSEDDEGDYSDVPHRGPTLMGTGFSSKAGPASPSSQQFKAPGDHKKWTCVYPIYIDAKRAYGTGERRIARAKSVWWPLSKDIADATVRLGLGTVHEVNKSHPRDWENPGRVRVQWKKDGRLVNPSIKTKKQLLEFISFQIQQLKPDNIPKPPFNMTPQPTASPEAAPVSSKTAAKGKQPASKTAGKNTSSTTQSTIGSTPIASKKPGRPLPVPPTPLPPLSNRVSPYSPALVSGVLIETIKAGMSQEGGGPAGPGGGPMGGGKGKKKVIRVRA
ncbi:Signal recognition particle, SRP19 subunit [Abortiporus biennis]